MANYGALAAYLENLGTLTIKMSFAEVEAFARMFRYALSPGDEFAYGRMSVEVDVRHVISAISAPTLVLNNADDHWVPADRGRELAAAIPTATYVELPLEGHVPADLVRPGRVARAAA